MIRIEIIADTKAEVLALEISGLLDKFKDAQVYCYENHMTSFYEEGKKVGEA